MREKKDLTKIVLIPVLIIFFVMVSYAQGEISVIPQPVKVIQHSGSFRISQDTKIIVSSDGKESIFPVEYFVEKVKSIAGYSLQIVESETIQNGNYISFNYLASKSANEEEYSLVSTADKIEMIGGSAKAMFYAVQTLLQLLPPEIFGKKSSSKNDLVVPSIEIFDHPRFAYRGMHLDVCRHFFPVSFIKKYIDYLAMHKLNTFHWHLTEDQGWRIEIKKYPKLTTISSRRKETVIGRTKEYDGKEYGGFYTQDEIREVVKYAGERFINVIPEIEMPGHTVAVLAAYPEYSCTGGPFEVSTKWGVREDIFCAGKEATFNFLEDVLSEVMEMFPSKYIHIGGDEAPKVRWENCPDCQERMKKEGLADEHELQSYFITRIEKYLNSNGRKIIGWDEILEGGLAPDATVMSWRGLDGGIAAAKKKHDVIMVPYSHLYFDGYQADKEIEPLAIGYWAPIEKVYEFDPVPQELSDEEQKYIIGAEATLWTEYISTEEYAEYMLMPRLAALSEILWSKKGSRIWSEFEARLQSQYLRYESMNINFRIPTPDIAKEISLEKNEKVEIRGKINSGNIIFTLDGSDPNVNSSIYSGPLSIEENTILKTRSILRNGRMSSIVNSLIKLTNM